MRRLFLIATSALFCGCTYAMIEHGQIRSVELHRLLAHTAATRRLPLPEQMQTRVIQRKDVPELLRESLNDEWHEGELSAAQEMMTTVGLWPDGLDLLTETIRVEGGEMAGLYS